MKSLLFFLIRFYQQVVSPWLSPCCRFYPSCSEWSKEAIQTYGAVKGVLLSLKRFFSCHPFHPGGYDPLLKNS